VQGARRSPDAPPVRALSSPALALLMQWFEEFAYR
jgi:hypothetical protein